MKKFSPHFVGLGGKYSGMASMTSLLQCHPEITSHVPCLHFFNSDLYRQGGIEQYQKMIGVSAKGVLVGECCPDYLSSHNAAQIISRECPDTKLFVMVRNPLERAIADYTHAKKRKKLHPSVTCAQYLTNHLPAQTDGFWGKHLSDFFGYYSPLQLHIIVYEDYEQNPLKVVNDLYAFLGVKKDFVPKALKAYAPPPEEPKHRGKISRLFRFIHSLFKKLRKEKKASPFLPPRVKPSDYFLPKELELFKKTYAVDAAYLSRLLNRDMISEWDLELEK